MLRICQETFFDLNNQNIRYCHWKSNEHLMDGLDGFTDLDILCDIKQKKKCEQLLQKHNFIHAFSQFGYRYKYIQDWIGFDYDTGKLIHFHLHYKLVTGKPNMKEFVLPWDKIALEKRILEPTTNVYVMNPNMEIIILYFRIVLKNTKKIEDFSLDTDYVKEIRYLKRIITLKEVKKFLCLMKIPTPNKILKIIFKDNFDKDDFLSLKQSLDAFFGNNENIITFIQYYFKHYKIALLDFICSHNEYYKVINKKCIGRKGKIYAFVGMDGSGKSSITKDIINWLDWKIECDYIYIGEGDNYKKPLWYKILQEALPEDNLNGIFKVVYYLLFSFRIKRLLFKCKNYRFRGGIAILDRYPQIQISGLNDGPKITNFIKNIANKSLYKLSLYFSSIEINNLKEANKLIPDIIFKLEVSPETSCKRKKENTIELMTKKHDSFKLITYNAKETISINTELSYEDSLLQIKRIIWKDINKK